jgi:hypothetical protein
MKNRRIDLILGKTGSGKSSFVKKELIPYRKRLVIIDALSEYENGVIFYNIDNFIEYIIENKVNHFEEFKYICRFTDDQEIELLFQVVFELSNLTLLVEECEIYVSPNAKSSNFLKIVRYGRHKNISVIGVARRSTELSLTFRSQTDSIISFKQTDTNDLKKMEELGLYGLDKLTDYKYPEKHKKDIHYKRVDY